MSDLLIAGFLGMCVGWLLAMVGIVAYFYTTRRQP